MAEFMSAMDYTKEFYADFGEVTEIGGGSSASQGNYEGPYQVTPKKEEQILETNEKVMSDDVTVDGIPYYEVSNSSGGVTLIIAS